MTDKAFLKLLNNFSKHKDLDAEHMNEAILKAFPDKEFLKGHEKSNKYFNVLVSFYLENKIQKSTVKQALIYLEIIYRKLYTNLTTLDNLFSVQVRKSIIANFGKYKEEHNMSKHITKISYDEKGQVIKQSKASLEKHQEEMIIYDSKEIIKIIIESMDSEDPFEKAIGLALASGCRPVELFNMKIQFEKLDDHWLTQSSVAKKRGAVVPVNKPIVGISAQKFIEEIDDMRRFINQKYKEAITQKGELKKSVESLANKTAKEMIKIDKITLYSCRKIYADISYSLYAKNSRVGSNPTIGLWRNRVLAHSEGDLQTQNHYSNVQAKGDQQMNTAELEAKNEVLEEKIKSYVVEKPVLLDVKEIKTKEYYSKIRETYDSQETKPTQTEIEILLKKIVPRSYIRKWYHENYKQQKSDPT